MYTSTYFDQASFRELPGEHWKSRSLGVTRQKSSYRSHCKTWPPGGEWFLKIPGYLAALQETASRVGIIAMAAMAL